MAEETEEKKIDETIPGGRYIVGDRVVNAFGDEIGKAEKAELKVDATPEPAKATTKKDK
jgi:hypothetical protein